MHDRVQQQALRVYQEMTLLAVNFLARIVAIGVNAGPPFSALLTLWLSMIAAVGPAARSMWSCAGAEGIIAAEPGSVPLSFISCVLKKQLRAANSTGWPFRNPLVGTAAGVSQIPPVDHALLLALPASRRRHALSAICRRTRTWTSGLSAD
jgi:hypothetical protein